MLVRLSLSKPCLRRVKRRKTPTSQVWYIKVVVNNSVSLSLSKTVMDAGMSNSCLIWFKLNSFKKSSEFILDYKGWQMLTPDCKRSIVETTIGNEEQY